jgi:BirA family biotin operon repressor/biotin-[acetyl-CoA-carboxylase] ligase
MKIVSFDRLGSTNAHALKLAVEGAQPETVVWALEQSAGRGQHGRVFSSPRGGLYFSLIFQPELLRDRLPLVTLAAGVGCCLCLEQYCAVAPVLLKWPNDLYFEQKKLGGILTESLPPAGGRLSTIVIGVGLNINSVSDDFSERLAPLLTSVKISTMKSHDLQELLDFFAYSIVEQIHCLEKNQDKLLALWHRRDYLKGRSILWDNGRTRISGIGLGILDDGRYALQDRSGTIHKILAGTLKPAAFSTLLQ